MRLWVVAIRGDNIDLCTTVHTSPWDAWDALRVNHTELPFGAAQAEIAAVINDESSLEWAVDVHDV